MSTTNGNANLVSIAPLRQAPRPAAGAKILLFKPPYFTPWTPPLGISILKSFLEQHGYGVRCFDFNTDAELWGMHHKYFAAIQTLEDVSINDGYSKLWWILNSHMLAYANGADREACARVLEQVIPLYGIRRDDAVIGALLPLVERFYARLAEAVDELELSDYSVVGTSTYSTSLGPSLFLLRRIKERHPHVRTVMGGGIFADDLALGSDNLDVLVEHYPYIDHVVLGEGELLFLKLLQGELAHKRVISIADLKGTTLQMQDVPSPDFSDMNLSNYYHLTIEGARSCPFQCSFCSETIQWGDYRKKPMDVFAGQVIELAQKNGNNSFFMGDSLMNPYILQFSKELLERKAGILYDGYLRADKPVTHRDRVLTWARSGLYRVRLGIESASARVLDSMDKMTTPAVISEALRSLAGAGIRTTTYWIVGFPGETGEDFEETLQFIRENHRYIYELEAHPYYYYPYGQIGSRLYECRSLYPQEVTDVIKFKVWDIIDCRPTREERYERLRRVSELASSFGLPNIYTMADRYRAEDRWMLLHPLTAEVYAGSRLRREQPQPPARAVETYGPAVEFEGALGRVVCHSLSIGKALEEGTLATALAELVRANETLRLDVRDGLYVAHESAEVDGAAMLSVYDAGVEAADSPGEFERGLAARLAAGMQAERGASLRVALVRRGDASRLLLLAHRGVADGRTTALLCEDLFRIYEQLSYGMQISLRPAGRHFTTFISELAGGESEASAREQSAPQDAEPPAGAAAPTTIALDAALMKRLNSESVIDYGTTPRTLMLGALLRSCAKAAAGRPFVFDLVTDNRGVEEGLEHTAGPLTRAYAPSPALAEGASDLRAFERGLRGLLAEAGRRLRHEPARREGARVLVNADFLMNSPWLGGGLWRSEGFLLDEDARPAGNGLVEVVALPRGEEETRVVFKRLDTPEAAEFVARAAGLLPGELDAALGECESYAAARRYWSQEFGKSVPKAHLEPAAGGGGEQFPEVEFEVSRDALRDIEAGGVERPAAAALAAYAALLSLLSGREEAVVVTADEAGETAAAVRLHTAGETSFRELVERAERKRALAFEHGAQVFEVASRELKRDDEAAAAPIFDAGFVFGASAGGREALARVGHVLEGRGVGGALSLLLQAVEAEGGGGLRVRLTSRGSVLGHEGVEKLAAYMRRIFVQAAADPCVPLRDIRPGEAAEHTVTDVLAADAFDFG